METLTSKAEADGLAQEKWADLFIGKNGSFWLWIQPIPARRDRQKPAKNRRSIVPIKLGAIQGSGGAGMNAHTDGCLM